jgi:hypothetical protein
MSLLGQSEVSADDAQLADFIEMRRTYRKRFAPREVSAPTLDQLIKATGQEGAR